MSSRICACLFRCNGYDDCTMTFSRSEHLARHVRKHTGERPFYCHCGRAFSRLDNVRQHATTVHGDQREENSTMMTALVALHVTLSHAAIISQREQGMIIPKGLKSETSIDFNSSGDEKKVRKSERAKKVKKAKKERQLSNYSESSAGGRQKIIRLSPPPTLPSPHPSPRVVVHQSFKQPPSQHASPQHSLPQHHSPHPTSPAKLNTMPQLSAAQFAYASSAYYSNSEAPASVNDSPISPFYSVRASPSSDRDSGPPPILTSAVRFYSPMFYGNQGTNLNSTNLVEESLLSRGGVTLPSISELLPSPFTRSSDDNKRIGEVQEAIYYEPLSDTVTVKMEPSFTTYSNLECQISSPTETYYEESYDGDSYEEEDIKPEPHQLQNSLYYGSTHSNPGSNYIYSVPNSFHYPTPQYIQPHPSNSIGIDYLNQTPRLYASAMSAMISRESSERSTNSHHHQYPQSPHPTPIPLESTSYYMAPSYETYPPIHYSNISNKRYEYTQYGALGVGPMRIDENHYQQGYAKRLREETEGDEREYKRFSSYGRI